MKRPITLVVVVVAAAVMATHALGCFPRVVVDDVMPETGSFKVTVLGSRHVRSRVDLERRADEAAAERCAPSPARRLAPANCDGGAGGFCLAGIYACREH